MPKVRFSSRYRSLPMRKKLSLTSCTTAAATARLRRLARCRVATDAAAQLGKLLRQLADAIVLAELSALDGARVVAILLPRLRVQPPRLHRDARGLAAMCTSVHAGRDRQQADPLQGARVTHEAAVAPPIAEVRLRALAEYPFGHVVDGRQKAVPQCILRDRAASRRTANDLRASHLPGRRPDRHDHGQSARQAECAQRRADGASSGVAIDEAARARRRRRRAAHRRRPRVRRRRGHRRAGGSDRPSRERRAPSVDSAPSASSSSRRSRRSPRSTASRSAADASWPWRVICASPQMGRSSASPR